MTDVQAVAWRERVRALAERLNHAGCKVQADLYEQNVDWTRWGPKMIGRCDFTLIVPSTAYRERWDGQNSPYEGAGATREINVLKGRFDKDQESFHSQTIIIMLPGVSKAEVPDEIYSYLSRFTVNPVTGDGVEQLLRHLTRQSEFVLPKRGEVPDLPPRPSAIHVAEVPSTKSRKKSLIAETTTWLGTAVTQRDEISRLVHRIESVGKPPSRDFTEEEFDEWLATLANWIDDTSLLVDEIEQVRSLAPKDPSVRYVQALENSRIRILKIIDDLDGPYTAAKINDLAEAAAELHQLVARLAQLALEP